jgi:hypothetical protein
MDDIPKIQKQKPMLCNLHTLIIEVVPTVVGKQKPRNKMREKGGYTNTPHVTRVANHHQKAPPEHMLHNKLFSNTQA